MIGVLALSALSAGKSLVGGAVRFVAGSKIAQIALVGLAALALVSHMKSEAYSDGLEAGLSQARAECRSGSLQAQVDEARRREAVALGVARAADRRAAQSAADVRERQQAYDRALAAARRSPTGTQVCLTQETTDALRAIPTAR